LRVDIHCGRRQAAIDDATTKPNQVIHDLTITEQYRDSHNAETKRGHGGERFCTARQWVHFVNSPEKVFTIAEEKGGQPH
jgi:hypothetical protein